MIVEAADTVQNVIALGPTMGDQLLMTFRGVLLGFTILLVAFRLVSYLLSEQFGKMFGVIFAAVPVIGFLAFPDQVTEVMKEIWKMLVGN